MNREIACGILEELGFVVDRAENGVAAIDKVLHCRAATTLSSWISRCL